MIIFFSLCIFLFPARFAFLNFALCCQPCQKKKNVKERRPLICLHSNICFFKMSFEDDQASDLKESDADFASKEKQEARCLLRERFLRAITSVVGECITSPG